MGVRWHQLKNLIRIEIKIDFRGNRGFPGQSKRWSPLIISSLFYFFMGCSMAISLRLNGSPTHFIFLTIAYSMLMMALAVIIEFGNTIVSPEDMDVLGYRPIDSKIYFFAKLMNFLFYVFFIGTSLVLGPTLLGIGFYTNNMFSPLVFYSVIMFANLFSGALMILIYTCLLYRFHTERFNNLLAYTQITITFFLIFFYQFVPRIGQSFLDNHLESSSKWLITLPPLWFTELFWGFSEPDRQAHMMVVLSILIGISVMIFVSFFLISKKYTQILSRIQISSGHRDISRRNRWTLFITSILQSLLKRILKKSEAQAGFFLTHQLVRRDRSIKMGLYGAFGIPLAFLLMALIEGNIIDPFLFNPFDMPQSSTMMATFFIFFMIHYACTGIITIKDWDAAWVFYSMPINSPAQFYRGVKFALFLQLMLPFFLILAVLYAVRIPILHAVKHTLTLFLIGQLAFSSLSLFIKDYPFSKRREKGVHLHRMSFLFFVGPFFGLTLLVQTFAYQGIWAWWLAQGIFLLLIFIIETFASDRLDRELGRILE